MEKQKLKKMPKMMLIASIILFILSLFPLNMIILIGGAILSLIVLIVTVLEKKEFAKNILLITLILSSISLITDIAFLYYVLVMI